MRTTRRATWTIWISSRICRVRKSRRRRKRRRSSDVGMDYITHTSIQLLLLRFEPAFFLVSGVLVGEFVKLISDAFHFEAGEGALVFEGESCFGEFGGEFDLAGVLFVLAPFDFALTG
jgi:hypothetical protein